MLQYMAAKFQEAGIPAETLSAETPRADRNGPGSPAAP